MAGAVKRWGGLALGLLGLALYGLLSRYFSGQLGDDGFIYFRYAQRIAAGLGPTWSLADAPAEGFSSPLWLGLLTLGELLGQPLLQWSRGLGLGFSLVAVVGVGLLARSLGAGPLRSGAAVVLASALHGLHYWAPSALETSLYAALLVTAALGLSHIERGGRWGWAIALGLLGIARPEAPALTLAGVAGAWWLGGRPDRRHLALALGPLVLWELYRLRTYGVPLPNTYYAKATGDLAPRLLQGLSYAGLVLPALMFTALAGAGQRAARVVAGLAALLLTAVVVGGGDWMFHQRLLVPVMVLVVALGLGVQGRGAWIGGLASLMLLPSLVPLPTLSHALRGGRLDPLQVQEGELIPASMQVAAWIRERVPPASTVAVNHAGVLGAALPGYRVLDMTGLNDAHIAQAVTGGVHQKWDADYVLSQEPDVVVLNSLVEPGTRGGWYHTGYWPGETALVQHPDFARDYEAVPQAWGRATHGGGRAWILLFRRR